VNICLLCFLGGVIGFSESKGPSFEFTLVFPFGLRSEQLTDCVLTMESEKVAVRFTIGESTRRIGVPPTIPMAEFWDTIESLSYNALSRRTHYLQYYDAEEFLIDVRFHHHLVSFFLATNFTLAPFRVFSGM